MATISVDVPDDVVDRIATALGWAPTADVSKGESLEFINGQVGEYIRGQVMSFEGMLAANAAQTAAVQKANSDIVATAQKVSADSVVK